MDGFDVVPGEIDSHASAVAGVASGVSQALSAGGTATGFTPEAFGLLCSFFTPPSIAVSTAGLAVISSQQQALSTLSTTLPVVADGFVATDTEVQTSMNTLEGEL